MADQKTPTPGEITIMAAGVVALIFSFLPFYGATDAFGNDQNQSSWSKGLFPIATLIALFLVVMAVQVALEKFANVNFPDQVAGFSWVQIHLALGFFAAILAVAFLIRSTGGADKKIGFWFMLIAALAGFAGAILLQRERAGGSTGGGSPSTGGGPTV